jgi:uncharacterized protein (DUF4415 family)
MNSMNDNLHAIWSESVRRSAPASVREPARKAAPAIKQIVTIRLDQDVLGWLKSQGPGYQTRINQMLRDQMAASADAQTD